MNHSHRVFLQLARAPILETERLILSAHTCEDFPAVAERWADPRVVRFICSPSSAGESWTRLVRFGGMWALLGIGYWAVREKPSLRCIGDAGFGDFHREVEPCIDGVPEAGWVFSPEVHGRGYAVEAMTAALGWLDTAVACNRSVCLIDSQNQPSLKLAQRLGFTDASTVQLQGEATLLLTRRHPHRNAA